MMTRVDTPQSRCRVGIARADITPPIGIYHRMWGAALHDQATGIHRPLTATALWLEALDGSGRLLILGLDHCLLDGAEFARIRDNINRAAAIPVDDVLLSMSHTHGSAWMSRSRSQLPGGDLIGPYLDRMTDTCARLAVEASRLVEPATILYGTARCSLAAHRDYWDERTKRFACGFNPDGPADDTVMVAKMMGQSGGLVGTLVNYACHPTTLAWQNTLISPDYVGSTREVIELETGVPCLFLQGSSGDLGPREGYVGEPEVADRNGRQLGFAALSGLESLHGPGSRFEYAGSVVSGALLGTWEHRPLRNEELARNERWRTRRFVSQLPYRNNLPTEAATRAELAKWESEEARARAADDPAQVSECRARAEQMTRQLARLASLPAGPSYPLPVHLAHIGGAVWVFSAGELYQHFQITIRRRFPGYAIVVATLTNDWQPGYIPAAGSYGKGIYQESIAAVAPGSLEGLTETVCGEIRALVEEG